MSSFSWAHRHMGKPLALRSLKLRNSVGVARCSQRLSLQFVPVPEPLGTSADRMVNWRPVHHFSDQQVDVVNVGCEDLIASITPRRDVHGAHNERARDGLDCIDDPQQFDRQELSPT